MCLAKPRASAWLALNVTVPFGGLTTPNLFCLFFLEKNNTQCTFDSEHKKRKYYQGLDLQRERRGPQK